MRLLLKHILDVFSLRRCKILCALSELTCQKLYSTDLKLKGKRNHHTER